MAIIEYYIGGQGPFLADTVLDADLLAHGGQVVTQDMLVASGPSPATTVTDETIYGVAKAVGTSLAYARSDHTHGSPADPLVSGLSTAITIIVGPLLTDTKVLTFTNGKLTGVL